MANPTKPPTKASVEFEGDCFGRLHDDDAAECAMCKVSASCKLVTVELDLGMITEDACKIEDVNLPDLAPSLEIKHGGTAHLCWGVLLTRPIWTFQELHRAFRDALAMKGIQLKDTEHWLRAIVLSFKKAGVIEYVERGVYRVVYDTTKNG